jgi:hypothetical protein
MMQLLVSNLSLVEDGCPPVVRCSVLDADGRNHEFVEKLAVLSTSPCLPAPDASIDCFVLDTRRDDAGRRVVVVDVGRPWGCETVDGLTTLTVAEDQLLPARM